MDTIQGDTIQVLVAPAAQEPTCKCCDKPVFGEGILTTGLCEQHTELRVYIWRLRRRGDEVSIGGVTEYIQRVRKPVTFYLSDLPGLWKSYADAGLLEEKEG